MAFNLSILSFIAIHQIHLALPVLRYIIILAIKLEFLKEAVFTVGPSL